MTLPGPNRDAFESLLRSLAPDRTEAAARYEDLRLRLTKFFFWRRPADGSLAPEDLADRTLDRLAAKFEQGERPDDVCRYAYSVARFLHLEHLREQERQREFRRELASQPSTASPRFDEEALAGLETCLGGLESTAREFILDYYRGDDATRVRNRKLMSGVYGIGLNALRNRALRIRLRLERCLSEKLQRNSP